jgi:hypothetical protein
MDEIEEKYEFIFLKDMDKNKIINLFNHDIIEEYNDSKYWYYVGLYYERKIQNYDLMKKYYLLAIDRGNDSAKYIIRNLYKYVRKIFNLNNLTHIDVELIIKYNLNDIELNTKIIFECDFINKNFIYLIKHKQIKKYYSLINLVYCD